MDTTLQHTRKRLKLSDKVAIKQKLFENNDWSYSKLGAWAKEEFDLEKPLSKAVISRIVQDESLLSMSEIDLQKKSKKTTSLVALEEQVEKFVLDMQARQLPVSGYLISTMALRFARGMHIEEEFKASKGWFDRFVSRKSLRSFNLHGEAASIDINVDSIQNRLQELRDIIAEYEPRDVFNLDETGLFYNQIIKRTYAKERISGTKIRKERITVVLMCNADGSFKFDPVFIGKAEKPRCFKKKTGICDLLFNLIHKLTLFIHRFRTRLHLLSQHQGLDDKNHLQQNDATNRQKNGCDEPKDSSPLRQCKQPFKGLGIKKCKN